MIGKNRIWRAAWLAGICVIWGMLAGCSHGGRAPAGAAAAPVAAPPQPAMAQLRPFQAEQTIGDIRVVLIRVSRSTVFTSEGLQSNDSKVVYGMPVASVEYITEYVGAGAVTKLTPETFSAPKYYVDGKRLEESRFGPAGIIAGGVYSIENYGAGHGDDVSRPRVGDPKRAFLVREADRGIVLSAKAVEVRIRAGFNGTAEEFVFRNVPLE